MSGVILWMAVLVGLGAALFFVGSRLAAQTRKLEESLAAEALARGKLSEQRGEIDEARDAAEGLRRELATAKDDAAAIKAQLDQQKEEHLLSDTRTADAAKQLEAKVAELVARGEAADRKLEEQAALAPAAQAAANAARERAAQLERQLADAQKKVMAALADGARLSQERSKADAAAAEARAQKADLDRTLAKFADAAKTEARLLEELDRARADLAAETQKREAAEAAVPPKGAGGVLAALDADPGLNRGARETLRMMYEKYTAKRGKGA
jgi:chromosome segregation ATPase